MTSVRSMRSVGSVGWVAWVASAALTLVLAGCSAAGTDRAGGTSSSAPAPSTSTIPAMTPAPPDTGKPVAFKDYLNSIGVDGTPAHFDKAPGLTVTVPVPDGWAQTSDPLFATGIEFVRPVGVEGNYPSVTLMAIELTGDFDPKDAIRHANADALPPTATGVTESYDDYQGFPSAAAEGIAGGTQHYSRIVIPTVPSDGKRYLVQLGATTLANQPIEQSPVLSGILAGFKVAVT